MFRPHSVQTEVTKSCSPFVQIAVKHDDILSEHFNSGSFFQLVLSLFRRFSLFKVPGLTFYIFSSVMTLRNAFVTSCEQIL